MKPNTIYSLALAGALLFSPLARADNTDYTDVWWNPQQAGWGMNLARQNDRIYATLHAYDTNGASLWYVAYLDEQSDNSFTGNIHTAVSTPTNAPLSPGQATVTTRGTLKFVPLSASEGRIYYNIDGQQGEQPVKRFSLLSQPFPTSNPMARTNDWSNFDVSIRSDCHSSFWNSNTDPATIKITPSRNPAAPRVQIDFVMRASYPTTVEGQPTQGASQYSCTIAGQLTSDGQLSKIDNAQYSCYERGYRGEWSGTYERLDPVWTNLPVKVTNIRVSSAQLDGYWDSEIPNLDIAANTQLGSCNQKGHFVFSMTP